MPPNQFDIYARATLAQGVTGFTTAANSGGYFTPASSPGVWRYTPNYEYATSSGGSAPITTSATSGAQNMPGYTNVDDNCWINYIDSVTFRNNLLELYPAEPVTVVEHARYLWELARQGHGGGVVGPLDTGNTTQSKRVMDTISSLCRCALGSMALIQKFGVTAVHSLHATLNTGLMDGPVKLLTTSKHGSDLAILYPHRFVAMAHIRGALCK